MARHGRHGPAFEGGEAAKPVALGVAEPGFDAVRAGHNSLIVALLALESSTVEKIFGPDLAPDAGALWHAPP